MKHLLGILLALFFSANFSYAQTPTQQLCYTTNGVNCAPSIQASNSVAINTSSATTTGLVNLVAGKAIYVTSWDVIANGTVNVTLAYGDDNSCATNQVALTGAYRFIAQAGISKGSGTGPVLFIPQGKALCIITSASPAVDGSLSYVQF